MAMLWDIMTNYIVWSAIGSVNLYTFDFCILGLTTMQSLCCRIFVKYKGVILIEK